MKCTKFELLVNEYVDGELKKSKESLEEHMSTCDACRALYEETVELRTLIADLEEMDLPDDFEATLHEKLVEASNERKVIPFYKHRGIKAVSSVAAVLLVSVLAFRAGTLLPADDMNEASNDSDVDVKYSKTIDSDMAMDDAEMAPMEAEMAEEVSDDFAGVTMTMADESVQLRFTMTAEISAKEEINYSIVNPDWAAIETFVFEHDIKDLTVDRETMSFLIHDTDFDQFSSELYNRFIIVNEVTFDYRLTLEEKVNELNESVKDDDDHEAQKQIEMIKANEAYIYIILREDKE